MCSMFWDFNSKEQAKKTSEERRKKAGGVAVPDDAEKKISDIITGAFSEMEESVNLVKLKFDVLFIKEIASFENELRDAFDIILSIIRRKTNVAGDKYLTDAEVSKMLLDDLKEAFDHFVGSSKSNGFIQNKHAALIFGRLHRDIKIGIRRLVNRWM
jgi:hypothetical protein